MTPPMPDPLQRPRREVFIEPVTRSHKDRVSQEALRGCFKGAVHGASPSFLFKIDGSTTASGTQGSRLSKSGSAPSLVEAVKLEKPRGQRARAAPEEASGYLHGVARGGSSSSTASATQGSRLSKSGSAPSLVEAAAVKLENQRLREEIRNMFQTIKSQSNQLSLLWAETQRLQARKNLKNGKNGRTASVSNLMAGVAELSRMQLDPGLAGGSGRASPLMAQSGIECEPAHGAVMQDLAEGPRRAADVSSGAMGAMGGIKGFLEPTTFQAKEEQQPSGTGGTGGTGAVSLFILAQNLNLSMLSKDLAASFRSTIQEDIAQELCSSFHPGFLPEHVDVRLLAESAAIPVTITTPSGVSCHDLHRWLCNKPLRWCAGHKLGKEFVNLEGFSSVCLSPSWCLCTVGMPSIVECPPGARNAGLAQDLPAVPDEEDLVLPRSLQRTGHTPRDGLAKPLKASPKKRPLPKAPVSSAKVKRNPREAKPNRENSSARRLNFSGLSDTPYYQPMLLGEGFGEEKEHISGLFVPSVDTPNFDSRVNSPQAEERIHRSQGVVTQPRRLPAQQRQPDVTPTVCPRQNSSDEEVTFIEDDSVSTPARAAGSAPRRLGASREFRRSVGVEQPSAPTTKRVSGTRSRTSSSHSAGAVPKAEPKADSKEDAMDPVPVPAALPASPAKQEVERSAIPAASTPAVSTTLPTTPKPAETPAIPTTSAASVGEKATAEPEAVETAAAQPKPKTEVYNYKAESEEESESSSEGDSEDESGDGAAQARPRRISTSAEVKDLIGDSDSDSESEEVERSSPTAVRTRAESLMSKE